MGLQKPKARNIVYRVCKCTQQHPKAKRRGQMASAQSVCVTMTPLASSTSHSPSHIRHLRQHGCSSSACGREMRFQRLPSPWPAIVAAIPTVHCSPGDGWPARGKFRTRSPSRPDGAFHVRTHWKRRRTRPRSALRFVELLSSAKRPEPLSLWKIRARPPWVCKRRAPSPRSLRYSLRRACTSHSGSLWKASSSR